MTQDGVRRRQPRAHTPAEQPEVSTYPSIVCSRNNPGFQPKGRLVWCAANPVAERENKPFAPLGNVSHPTG